MVIEQVYTSCLAQASYFITSGLEAIVIDPIREVEPYLELAKEGNVSIKYIFETHFHADFVSGHIDLAEKTGAKIIFGPNAKTDYKSYEAKDNELFEFGNTKIKVLHTPGHTLESTSYLLFNEEGKEKAVFTGDTLFIGEVGRPDLAVNSELTSEDLAGMLFDSLQNKIKTLNENTIVYPGHGAGSSCGKNIGKERFSTIAEQKKNNYALKVNDKDEFIKKVCEQIPSAPDYFKIDAGLNKSGYQNLDKILKRSLQALDKNDFIKEADNKLVLDSRNPEEFEKGYIPNAINIGLNGQFAIWSARLLKFDQEILLVVENEEKAKETIIRLARIGIETVVGYLCFDRSKFNSAELETINSLTWEDLKTDGAVVIDIREENEREQGYFKNSISLPLSNLEKNIQGLNKEKNYKLYCAGGYRSMIGTSLFRRFGFNWVENISGGFSCFPKGNNSQFVTE